MEGLTRFLWFYMEITPKIKDIVAKFVRECSVGGIVTEESRARLGVMTWRVDGQSKQ